MKNWTKILGIAFLLVVIPCLRKGLLAALFLSLSFLPPLSPHVLLEI